MPRDVDDELRRRLAVRYGSCSSLARHLVGVSVPALVCLLSAVLVAAAAERCGHRADQVAKPMQLNFACEHRDGIPISGALEVPACPRCRSDGRFNAAASSEDGIPARSSSHSISPGSTDPDLVAITSVNPIVGSTERPWRTVHNEAPR